MCNQLDAFYTAYQGLTTPKSLTDYFNEYFKLNVNNYYTLNQITALKKQCCKYVENVELTAADYQPPFPEFMECRTCVSCAELTLDYNAALNEANLITNQYTPEQKITYITNTLNQKYNQELLYSEYIEKVQICSGERIAVSIPKSDLQTFAPGDKVVLKIGNGNHVITLPWQNANIGAVVNIPYLLKDFETNYNQSDANAYLVDNDKYVFTFDKALFTQQNGNPCTQTFTLKIEVNGTTNNNYPISCSFNVSNICGKLIV